MEVVMHHTVQRLLQFLPPPPEGGDMVDWDQVHANFGWRLPNDYRDFVAVYGMGAISDSLGIATPPFAGYPCVDHLVYERSYPPSDNLLRWGTNEGGDDFLWRCTDADPNHWTVAVLTRSQSWHDYDLSMVDFLVHLVSGHITPPLNAQLTIDPPTFESWREEDRRMRETDD
ncbi:hypothetical protein [Streptomyces sp. H39-C1]|uniref:hypothetical protein n=1 Tax=Streptomyces sp. H39-C1 TaxID=3004355 RepID=UPI0022B01997|nr:hypothetical protein [Streptomyces sp. H39-C1]MCZ4100691.1 hypothetical protein [Streptomyces sp. H39-C1]